MTTNWINKVKPWHNEWATLSEEKKENFYRHNYIHRPENIAKKEIDAEDPLLKVVRNWISDDESEQVALSEAKSKIKAYNEQLSKTR